MHRFRGILIFHKLLIPEISIIINLSKENGQSETRKAWFFLGPLESNLTLWLLSVDSYMKSLEVF